VAVVASMKKNSVACTSRVFGTFMTSAGAECKNRWKRHSKRCGQLFCDHGDMFLILGAFQRLSSRAVGRTVLYGPSTCVVRMPGGSWPYEVVRRATNWI